MLAAHKPDENAYVRKSIDNAIRDISKKHSKLVSAELSTWDLSSKEIHQVYKLASKFLKVRILTLQKARHDGRWQNSGDLEFTEAMVYE